MKSNRIIAVIWGVFSAYMLLIAIAFTFESHYVEVVLLFILAAFGGCSAVARWKRREAKVLSTPPGNKFIAVIWGVFSVSMLAAAIYYHLVLYVGMGYRHGVFKFGYLYILPPLFLLLAGLGGYRSVVRWRKSESEVSTVPPRVRGIRFHAIAASVMYVLDAFFLGQGFYAFLVLIIFILVGLGQTLIKALRGQRILMTPFRNMAIYAICFVAVISTIGINNEIARSRAAKMIFAVKQYKAKYHRYPETLQTMVPEFLPSVPLAKYTLLFNDFKYWRKEYKIDEQIHEAATLLYVRLPPFGRPIFHFEENRWGYID